MTSIAAKPVSIGRVLRSEWIKTRTLRFVVHGD